MDHRIRIVIALIEGDLRQEPSLESLAQSVNLSPSRLRHLFKYETGVTPAQYLKSLRLRQTKLLLETTFLSVKVIMNRVGVSNESHFIQDFKRAYGFPPSRYRALSKNEIGFG